jgi:beta-lactamase superfamily II metal-dependent hydrolase
MKVYMLDVGDQIYGDCILAVEGETRILIDGAHPGDFKQRGSSPSIPDQLHRILGAEEPIRIDLLVVTHCHSDHIGCLPALVEQRIIKCGAALVAHEDLGFPRRPEDKARDDAMDAVSRQVLAALREEPPSRFRDKQEFDAFLADALNLEQRYRGMLKTFENAKIPLVRYIGPDDPEVKKLEKTFAGIGLKVLGPSKDHLLLCADAIANSLAKARDALDGIRSRRADLDASSLYQMFVNDSIDDALPADSLEEFLDMPGKGAALNDQSILLKLGAGSDAVLLTGDMQFADAEVSGLDEMMSALLKDAAAAGPYAFVKLPHHASYNGFDENVLAAFAGTHAFGISTGRGDSGHPNAAVLRLLKKNRKTISWARTDKNGRVGIAFEQGQAKFEIDHGKLGDFSPNAALDMSPPLPEPPPTPGQTSAPPAPQAPRIVQQQAAQRHGAAGDMVEVTARIPHLATRVTIAIDVAPGDGGAGQSGDQPGSALFQPARPEGGPARRLQLAPGRTLPDLLFVTSSARLEKNIGREEAAAVLAAIRDAGQTLLDLRTPDDPFPEVKAAATGKKGVVILGGYDVAPSQRYDVLPPDIRRAVGNRSADPDNFVVWSDQSYGDTDGDGLADVPVSRVPDGRSAVLMRAALSSAPKPSGMRRFGLRNDARPFAIDIFGARVPGSEAMLASQPTAYDALQSASVDAERIYIMLHGSDLDGTTYWGEDATSYVEAMKVGNIPDPCGGVVFAGCCWGALTTRTKAKDYRPGQPIDVFGPEQSIALSFLGRGARAFIGCTGAHYSPEPVRAPATSYFGGPMHDAFWNRIEQKMAPAEALFTAKKDYIAGMPHGRIKPVEQAVEYKILRAFTCLGLGW